jgi:hypothetical protein
MRRAASHCSSAAERAASPTASSFAISRARSTSRADATFTLPAAVIFATTFTFFCSITFDVTVMIILFQSPCKGGVP